MPLKRYDLTEFGRLAARLTHLNHQWAKKIEEKAVVLLNDSGFCAEARVAARSQGNIALSLKGVEEKDSMSPSSVPSSLVHYFPYSRISPLTT